MALVPAPALGEFVMTRVLDWNVGKKSTKYQRMAGMCIEFSVVGGQNGATRHGTSGYYFGQYIARYYFADYYSAGYDIAGYDVAGYYLDEYYVIAYGAPMSSSAKPSRTMRPGTMSPGTAPPSTVSQTTGWVRQNLLMRRQITDTG